MYELIIQSNLCRSFFTGLKEKNEQKGKNDASGINVLPVKLQKICNAVKAQYN